RADELWNQRWGCVSSDGRLCGSHPQGRQARGFACHAVEQVRASHQSAYRPRTRHRGATKSARPRRRGHRVRRREFITLLGGAAAGWPLAARAQRQGAMPIIGFLNSNSESSGQTPDRLRAFRQGLSETGYYEGGNVVIEYRWAEFQFDRLPKMATELVGRQVTVIAAGYNVAAARAAKTATTTIPIVFQIGVDPVRARLVASLNRPGGNLTGVINLSNEVVPKHVQLLHELVPAAKVIALLVNPTNSPAAENMSRDMQAAARTIGLQLHVLHASTERDFETVF